jgi:three-Cys-motif partner protein
MPRPDNDPEKWELDEHTKVKHEILEKYFKAWIQILSSSYNKIGYFDCFAGRGVYNNGEPGSPIIVMKAAQEKIDQLAGLQKALCAFIENNEDNFQVLVNEISQCNEECKDVQCETYNDDFANVIRTFLNESEGKSLIPVLFFIDPFGWKGISFEDIQRILSHRYSEILFVLMTYEIARWSSSPYHEESLTELYGGDEWKEATKYDGEKRHEALVQIYENKLKKDTDATFIWSFRVNDSDMHRRTKYYIIHATHHIKGLRVMKNIMRNQGAGIFAYLGPEDDILRKQQRFNFFNLGDFLLASFKGRSVTFDDLCDELYPITRHKVSEYIDKDFRSALKDLEKNGQVQITRVHSKRTGLNKTDIIHFPK